MKKLYRSKENKIFAGIIGGIGEYFEVDPVILRVAWVILMALSGFFPLLIAYIILIFIIPKNV